MSTEPAPTRLRRVLAIVILALWEMRGDLLVLAGATLILAVLWTIDWRLAVAPAGATLVALGLRL